MPARLSSTEAPGRAASHIVKSNGDAVGNALPLQILQRHTLTGRQTIHADGGLHQHEELFLDADPVLVPFAPARAGRGCGSHAFGRRGAPRAALGRAFDAAMISCIIRRFCDRCVCGVLVDERITASAPSSALICASTSCELAPENVLTCIVCFLELRICRAPCPARSPAVSIIRNGHHRP